MPTFRIEQYELHAVRYIIEAKDKAEAILKVLNGRAQIDDDEEGFEYLEVAEDFYRPSLVLTAEEIDKLKSKGHPLNKDGGIPSIRCAEEV